MDLFVTAEQAEKLTKLLQVHFPTKAAASAPAAKKDAQEEESKKKKKNGAAASSGWKKGTGYGSGHTAYSVLQVEQIVQKRKQRREELIKAFKELIAVLMSAKNAEEGELKSASALLRESSVALLLAEQFQLPWVDMEDGDDVLAVVAMELALILAKTKATKQTLASSRPYARAMLRSAESMKKKDQEAMKRFENVLVLLDALKPWAMEEAEKDALTKEERIAEEIAAKIRADSETTVEVKEKPEAVSESEYVVKLADQRFDWVPEIKNSVFGDGPVLEKKAVKRLLGEYANMGSNLPISEGSGIFVRASEANMADCRMLITGPEDTPYANGIFLFDVQCPSNYPDCNPTCNIISTGGGMAHFNPNLYSDGTVCLSLLGTWEGDPSESWNPATSSLLQLAVSIQSLILVPEPYFNEPGYESSMGSPAGDEASRKYSLNIRDLTLQYAILDMLKNPPVMFESVVREHFRQVKAKLSDQVRDWRTPTNTPVVNQILDLLAKL